MKLLFSAPKDWVKHSIKKDKNASSPFYHKTWRTRESLVYKFIFDETCLYRMETADKTVDEDQMDWNKGGGLGLHPGILASNAINSVMWAWRSDKNKEKIQLTAFSNVNKRMIMQPTMCEILPGREGQVTISRISPYEYKVKFLVNDSEFEVVHTHEIIAPTAKIVLPWFGGADTNKNGVGGKAPHDLHFYTKII